MTVEQEEAPPAWRIEEHGGRMIVTDGVLHIAARNTMGAIYTLGALASVLPGGTAKPSHPEVQRAKRDGWRAGLLMGAALGVLMGVCVAGIVQLLGMMR